MKIKRSSLECFILLMPAFQPICMSFFKVSANIYQLISLLVMAYVILFFVRNRRILSTLSFLAVALRIWISLVTWFNDGNVGTTMRSFQTIAIIALVLDMYSERIQILLKSLMLHFEMCIYINLITIIVRPDGFFQRLNDAYGITQEWFLGADNYFVVWVVPAIMMAFIYKYFFEKSVRCYILVMASIITEVICGSTTGLIGVILLTALIIVPKMKVFITPFRGSLIAVLLFVMIVFVREYDFFGSIVEEGLNKSMSLSSRLTIWDNAIDAIIHKPITGYGVLDIEETIKLLGNIDGFLWKGATHCHCHPLQVALQGGIVGLCIYISMFILSLKKCVATWQTRMGQVFAFSIIVFVIISISEVFEFATMYLIIYLPYYANKCVEQSKNFHECKEKFI